MNQDQTDLLHRVFAVNEQIVKQNYQIMMVLTQPTITKSKEWKDLTNAEIGEIYRVGWANIMELSRAIEAKIKEINCV
jgi:hypothetical protein